MRKVALFGTFLLFALALTVAPNTIYAGDQCGAYKSYKSSDASRAKSTTINATADAKQCPSGKSAACCAAKEVKIVSTDSEKEKDVNASLAVATFSVKGMTCGGCESQVSSTLASQDGVTEVMKVCHNSAKAIIKYNPEKADPVKIASVINKLGYETEIVPAEQETDQETVKTETQEL